MKNKKKLIWVYPPNNWKSTSHKTFVYGWSDPKANLVVSVGARRGVPLHAPAQKIYVYSNGNFAQTIKLPHKKNIVRLVQILGKRKTILRRKISVGATVQVARNKDAGRGTPRRAPTGKHYPHKKMTIVIDPGHGGKEHGTHSPKGIPEKYFNLQIAKLLFKKLNNVWARRGVPIRKIGLTRTHDKFVSLKDRVNFTKNVGARRGRPMLISIHHNALPDNEDPLKHRGVGVYYTHDFVKPFAKKLLFNISKESGLRRYGIFKRNFFVTKPGFYKGVLIECGFLTHPVEGEYVTRREVQEKIVRGIVNAIKE